MPKIIWFSRHPALPSQITELKRLFGPDCIIQQDPNPFSTADDVVRRFKKSGGNEMVVVAPLSVFDVLCKRGIHPLWAEMQEVPREQAEVVARGKGYKFSKFKRVKRLVMEFEDI